MSYLCSPAAVARRLMASRRQCASLFLLPRFVLCSPVIAILALALVSHAQAQSTWNTTTGSWNTSGNWSPAGVPVSDSSTSLIFAGSSDYTSTNDIGNFTLNQLLFTNTAGTVTLAASTNVLDFVNAGRAMLPAITLSGAGSATISALVTLDGETTVANSGSGTLQFTGTQAYANGTKQTFINSGTGTLNLADGITYGTSGSNAGLVLNLINNNTATGTFNIGDLGGLDSSASPGIAGGLVTVNVGGTGTVRYNMNSGGSAGDLFGSSTLLNVLSGATFDFNSNGETMGAISGAGTIAMTGASVSTTQVGYFVFSGKLTGTGALSVNSTSVNPSSSSSLPQTLVLSGSTSNYTGTTSVLGGTLIVSANAPSGSAGALGNATSDVLVGNTSGSNFATLVSDTAGVTIGRNIRVQSVNTGVMTVGGTNTSGTVTYSGNVILGTNTAAAKGVTLTAAAGGTVEFTGGVLRATSATGATDTLTVAGGGTVALRGANTFTGATTINAGTLLLDDATNNGQKLSSTAGLTLSGGSLTLLGSSSATSSQTVSGLTLGNSSSPLGAGGRITVTSGSGQTASMILGAITRNTGATVDFNPTNAGASITTSTANNTSVSTGTDAMNILGAYATYKLNDWAVNDGSGNIVALAAGSYGNAFGSGLHTSLSATTTTLASGGATTNTLRLTGTSAVAFTATGDTLTIESGGILVASTAGVTSIGNSSKKGVIATSTGELIVQQQSSSTLTITSAIGGTNLTKSGTGTLVLAGTNTYTGNTTVNGGTLSVTATANLGATTAGLTINGGTLLLASGSLGTVSSTGHIITVGPAGATFNFAVAQSFSGNGFSGTGTVTKLGVGAWSVGANSSTFNGNIVVGEGSLTLSSNQLTKVTGITVSDGATYGINDDGIGTFNIAGGARFVITGNGLSGNGAIRLTDQTQNISGSGPGTDPLTTMINEIALQATSRIQVENGSAVGSQSQLVFAGNVTGAGGLDKTGNGVLTLTARDNSYSGSTLVENGTLRVDLGNDRLPTGTSVTLGTGSTSGVLQLNGFSQAIAGLTTAGTGTTNAVIGGSATSTSLLDVNLASGSQTYGGTLGGTGLNNTSSSNNLGFIKDGAGSVTLSGANTYNGATTVNQGALVLGNASALGSGGASLASGTSGTTVNAGATLDLNGQSNVQEVITLNGTGLSGAGALVNNSGTPASIGSGVSSLSFSAVTTTGWSSAAAVTIGSPSIGTGASATAQLGLGSGTFTVTNGGSGFTGSNGVVTVSGGGGSGAVVTPSLGLTSATFAVTSGDRTYTVAPTVTLTNGFMANGTVATATANLDGTGKVVSITLNSAGSGYVSAPTVAFTGGTILSPGTTAPTATANATNFTLVGFNIVNPGTGYTSLPTVSITGGTGATATVNDSFVLNGVTLDAPGGGYTSTPSVNISGGSATVTANLTTVNLATDSSVGGSGALTIDAAVTGSGGLTKVGTGTTTLTGTNTYAGTTTVSAGTLQVGVISIGQSGAGALTVNGATAVLAGTGMMQGSTSVILGEIKPGDSGGAGTGTLNTHDLNFVPVASSTVAELQLTGSTAGASLAADQINITGALTLNSFSNILVNGTGYTAAVGDSFTLLDWSGVVTLNGFSTGTNLRTGANSAGNEGNLDLPDITGVGLWQISSMLDAGALTLTIVAVPEPTRGLLMLLGGFALLLRRRRK